MSAVGLVAAQAVPAPADARAPDGVAAWRQVFEREQMAALDKFRSVPAPACLPAQSPPRAAPRFPAKGSAATPPSAGAASRVAPAAARVSGTPSGLLPATAPSVSRSGPDIAPATPAAGTPQPALDGLRGNPARHAEPDSMPALPALTALTENWPSRKLHGMASAEGLHLWLRDAGATPQDPALQRWLRELQRFMGATGMRLASFTLNGRACPVPTIVS